MIAKFDVRYERGHSCAEEWELTELCCLQCGKKSVWRQNGDGGYEGVPSHLCLECKSSFIGRLAPAEIIEEEDLQRFEAFRKALAIPGATATPQLALGRGTETPPTPTTDLRAGGDELPDEK